MCVELESEDLPLLVREQELQPRGIGCTVTKTEIVLRLCMHKYAIAYMVYLCVITIESMKVDRRIHFCAFLFHRKLHPMK